MWLWMGVAMWATMIGVALFGRSTPLDCCPGCRHDTGVTESHCSGHDDNIGCRCQNDWHWNYDSVTLPD